jgi:hypothetical protein
MKPMTALRIVDIHSNAAKLLPKPMLPKAAKIAKMLIRRQKRASTWIDLSSCGRSGSCAKFGTLGYAFYDRRDAQAKFSQ